MSKRTKLRYTGAAGRRIVDTYEWNAANGYVQTVTSQKLVELLMTEGDFVIVEEPEQPAEQENEHGVR